MKMKLLTVALASLAMVASATTTYFSEDFSSAAIFAFTGNTVDITNQMAVGENANNAVVTVTNGVLQVLKSAKSSHGATFTIPGSALAGAGTYSLKFDYVAPGFATAAMRVYEFVYDGAGATNYVTSQNYKFGKDKALSVLPINGATAALVRTWGGGKGNDGTASITFTYSGTGDIAFLPHRKNKVDWFDNGLTTFDNIEIANFSPIWAAETNITDVAVIGVSYSNNLNDVASDPEGGVLTFSTVDALPDGLSLSANGEILGTATAVNVGTNLISVLATDAQGETATAFVQIEVKANNAPEWAVADTNVLSAGLQDAVYVNDNLTNIVTDTDGDPLTFAVTAGPAWLTISPAGDLSGTPTAFDVGTNYFGVTVSDGVVVVATVLEIQVQDVNDAPYWALTSFLKGYVGVGQSLDDTLTDRAFDWEDDTLTFINNGGPAWLTIAPDGTLSGSPLLADLGLNTWNVSLVGEFTEGVTNDASFSITVIEGTLVYEALWNVDTPLFSCANTVRSPKLNGIRAWVDHDVTTGEWVNYWITETGTDPWLRDGGGLRTMEIGAGNGGVGGQMNAFAVSIPAADFVATGAGWYELTTTFVTNGYYNDGADDYLGMKVYNAELGTGIGVTNDYVIQTVSWWQKNPIGSNMQVYPNTVSNIGAVVEHLASKDAGAVLGEKNLAFNYDGDGDVVIMFSTASPTRSRVGLDNIRVFKVNEVDYATWAATHGGNADPALDSTGNGIADGEDYAQDVNNDGASDGELYAADGVKYVHPKRRYDSSLTTYAVKTTDDLLLGTWSNLNVAVAGISDAAPGQIWESVTNNITTTNDTLFIDLTVDVTNP